MFLFFKNCSHILHYVFSVFKPSFFLFHNLTQKLHVQREGSTSAPHDSSFLPPPFMT